MTSRTARRTSLRLLAGTAAAAAALLGTVQPAMAGPTHEIRPAALERGENAANPYVRNTSIVDGTRTISMSAASVLFEVDRSGDGYVVSGINTRDRATAWYVAADGSRRVITSGFDTIQVSDDGSRVATGTGYRPTTYKSFEVSTGDLLGLRSIRGAGQVLDVHGGRVLVGGDRTYVWTVNNSGLRRVTMRDGYFGDLSNGLVASFTGDTYQGGCSVLSKIATPNRAVSRSCSEAVWSVNPAGTRMVTAHILSDGPGPGRLTERRINGAHLANFDAPWTLGQVSWENNYTLQMQVDGTTRTAMVRCLPSGCERTSPLWQSERY